MDANPGLRNLVRGTGATEFGIRSISQLPKGRILSVACLPQPHFRNSYIGYTGGDR